MGINAVQFQSGLSLTQFMDRYGTEAKCYRALYRRLAPGTEVVYTDGLACFRRLEDAGRAATQAQGARWVNIVLANVKRAISGVYHALRQAKYARRYLAEAAYRFNRRFRLRDMLPRLATALMRCKPCPERVLRPASNFHG